MKIEETKEIKDNKTIYHYTNWIAFEGIIGKKKLRLTNVSFSNDSMELLECLYKYQYNDIISLFIDKNHEYKDDPEILGFDYALENVKRNPLFACCFTENKDDSAQWDRYAVNGLGVCIGFNKKIKDIFQSPFKFDCIKYELNKDEKTDIENIKKIIPELKDKNIKDMGEFNKSVKEGLYEMFTKACFLKKKLLNWKMNIDYVSQK